MTTTTCDDCGADITTQAHWEIAYVVPARDGISTISDTRNTFCTNCW